MDDRSIARLRELAKAATAGPWERGSGSATVWTKGGRLHIAECETDEPGLPPSETRQAVANANYIAALPPEVTLHLFELIALLRLDQPWPLRDVIAKLVGATEHLLSDHGCDEHGHEETRRALIEGLAWIKAYDAQATAAVEHG
jgi:hypothetical protein